MLDYSKKDGSTNRQHYQMIEKLSGKKQSVLTLPEINNASVYLLETFFELNSTRGYTENGGIKPITYTEMKSYVELTDNELEPWEIDIMKQLDRAYIGAVYKQRTEEE